MTDKQKIVSIYVGVGVISALILAVTFYIRSQGTNPEAKPYYTKDSRIEPLIDLDQDIALSNQDGDEIKLSQLKGKVWAFAQFYASCPMCAKRNGQGLKQLYDRFKNEPDFHLVCITVNPTEDGVEEMKGYAEALGANTKNWWFLTAKPGEAKALLSYMTNVMKYDPIQKRTDPDAIAKDGALAHNMSIAVYNKNMSMVGRENLTDARAKSEAIYKETEKKLHQLIEAVIQQP